MLLLHFLRQRKSEEKKTVKGYAGQWMLKEVAETESISRFQESC